MRSRPDQTATQSMSSAQLQASQRQKKASPRGCSRTTKGTGVHRIAMIALPWKATILRHEETTFTAKMAPKCLMADHQDALPRQRQLLLLKHPDLCRGGGATWTGPVTSRESRLTICEIEKPHSGGK